MSFETPVDNRDDAIAAYRENKLYDLRGGSLTKCENFIDACRFLLEQPLSRSEESGAGAAEFEPQILERTLRQAEAWYHNNYRRLSSSGDSHRYADFSNYRD